MTKPRQDRQHAKSPAGLLRTVGPELVSGASDTDPTNLGTAAMVGAQTAYQLSWVVLLIAPMLSVVQSIAAHLGVVARGDLQSLTVKRYGARLGALLAVSVVVVNIVTIAADVDAGAAGIGLLTGVDPRWLVFPLGLGLVALLLIGRYDELVAALRYLSLGLFIFAAAAIIAHPDWLRVMKASLVPHLPFRRTPLAGALALVGTTLTSYVYVWETVERGVEEPADTSQGRKGLARARLGAVAGAIITAAVFWFMLIASAATLGQHHITVASAQDAARALRPVAGSLASDLFAAGLVVSALVALPVLMATTAYVVGAQFDWRRGLSQGIGRARGFYAVLGSSVVLAMAITLAGVSVIDLLYAASVMGGLGTPIGLVLLVRLARDHQMVGDTPISKGLAVAGWAVALVVGGLGLLIVAGLAFGGL